MVKDSTKTYFLSLMTDQRQGFLAGILKLFLWIFSGIYRIAVNFIIGCYRIGVFKKEKLKKPVLSVGNLTVGGVGKTPLVEFIARFLKDNNINPVILIRGYMSKNNKIVEGSDEAELLRQSSGVPVMVGRDRVKSSQNTPEGYRTDVFLMDDGFQHWRVSRDLDIVAIDATDPFGNGYLLPRGTLREPLKSLNRADIVVLTKTDIGASNLEMIKQRLLDINPAFSIIETLHEPVALGDVRQEGQNIDLAYLKDKKICSFCSIGNPDSFVKVLTSLGARVQRNFAFIDHHIYEKNDIQQIADYCLQNNIKDVVTTHKDVVKLKTFLHQFEEEIKVFTLDIHIKITKGEEEFLNRIREKCSINN